MKTTLRERQDQFIADLEMFDTWQDRFTCMMEHHGEKQALFPNSLKETDKLPNCRSNTYFQAKIENNELHCAGWSNSALLSGLIAIICQIFNGTPRFELKSTTIDFHTKSELTNNLTPLRREGLEEIIGRIKKCCQVSE